jgi:hypothetical protein
MSNLTAEYTADDLRDSYARSIVRILLGGGTVDDVIVKEMMISFNELDK